MLMAGVWVVDMQALTVIFFQHCLSNCHNRVLKESCTCGGDCVQTFMPEYL